MQTDELNAPTKDRERLGCVQVITRQMYEDLPVRQSAQAEWERQVRRYAAEHGYLVEQDTWTITWDYAQVTYPDPDDPSRIDTRPATEDDPEWNMTQGVVQVWAVRGTA